METFEETQVMFRHPFRALIYGVSGSGKTIMTANLIANLKTTVDTDIRKILYCYSEYQKCYDDLLQHGVEFMHGLPTSEEQLSSFSPSAPGLIVIDDLMGNVSQLVSDLFTKYSHHRSISVIYLVQNLFPKDPYSRTISLNSNILVLFANPRDKTQVRILAKQIFPGEGRVLLEAYNQATLRPHGYLIVDLQKDTPANLRLRTNIFPGEGEHYVYVKTA
jgi:SpoVK/Ycf46/Vps4 family AAA+-type ATPase